MPHAALRLCTYPGCTTLVHSGRCSKHPAINNGRYYPRDPSVQRMYNSKEWKRLRRQQLEDEPFCRDCAKAGKITKATEVDHEEPHKGDEVKFFHGKLQSLCHSCHTAKTDRERVGV